MLLVGGVAATGSSVLSVADRGEPVAVAVPETPSAAAADVTPACCRAAKAAKGEGLLYCPLTETINEKCCCKVVDGKWVCQVTGTVSDDCCCIKLTSNP
jgi:hypothetical protein